MFWRGKRSGSEIDARELSPAQVPLSEAIALGFLHGPTELLPVSSSAHTTLVPWLLGWSYPRLNSEARKTFEVALHAGTAAALVWRRPGIRRRDDHQRSIHALRPALLLISAIPAGVVGLLAERRIARDLNTPTLLAGGLAVGALALAAADQLGGTTRSTDDATCGDALALGIAQSVALVPGISRSGATMTAARALGFSRPATAELARVTALPVIAGATGLKAIHLLQRETSSAAKRHLLAGGLGAFVSTRLAMRLIKRTTSKRSISALVVYRLALAALIRRRSVPPTR